MLFSSNASLVRPPVIRSATESRSEQTLFFNHRQTKFWVGNTPQDFCTTSELACSGNLPLATTLCFCFVSMESSNRKYWPAVSTRSTNLRQCGISPSETCRQSDFFFCSHRNGSQQPPTSLARSRPLPPAGSLAKRKRIVVPNQPQNKRECTPANFTLWPAGTCSPLG